MTDEAERIAARLSDTMANALLHGHRRRNMDDADYFVLSPYTEERTRKALVARGLVRGTTITPLGLAVRRVLQNQEPSK